jgi:hypothetical protein
MVFASFISPGHHTAALSALAPDIRRSSGMPWNCGMNRAAPANGWLHSSGGVPAAHFENATANATARADRCIARFAPASSRTTFK